MKNVLLLGSNLLGALDSKDRDRITPHLQQIALPAGHVIYEPGDDVQFAYFPRYEALAGFLIPMPDGEAVEAAMIGREGAVGGIVSQGRLPAYARCCVTQGGEFLRIPSIVLDDLKRESPAIDRLFTRYADCLVAQILQSVACNARHSIEQRAARWLSVAVSRTVGDHVIMTQAQLGMFLGVGRSYVARVLKRLREQGIIQTKRGGITILDRKRLMAMSCDCTELIADHFDTVLRGVYPHETEPGNGAPAETESH